MAKDLTDDLTDAIAKRDAVVIVGAGVSMAATEGAPCASWTGLLKHGVDHCAASGMALPKNWAERVRDEIDAEDLEELMSAAEKISRGQQGRAPSPWTLGNARVRDSGHPVL